LGLDRGSAPGAPFLREGGTGAGRVGPEAPSRVKHYDPSVTTVVVLPRLRRRSGDD